jgi:nitrous-oxide reductase
MKKKNLLLVLVPVLLLGAILYSCSNSNNTGDFSDAASKVYVAPGTHDEFYAFMSGGFSGQVSVYGLPSGRLFKVISVFSQNPETGYG